MSKLKLKKSIIKQKYGLKNPTKQSCKPLYTTDFYKNWSIMVYDYETEKHNETDRFNIKEKLVCLYSKNKKDEIINFFYTTNDFLEFIIKSQFDKVRFYAHNGGKFDIRYILNWFSNSDNINRLNIEIKEFDIIDISGSFNIKLAYKLDKRLYHIEFYDSYKLLSYSLKQLAIDFEIGYNKKEVDFNTCDMDTLKDYCLYDCKILYEVLTKFLNEINSICEGNDTLTKLTIAAQSMDIYRRVFLKEELKPYDGYDIDNDDYIDRYIRQGYFGGKTEVYKMYAENVYYYDINSLYPYVASVNTFPIDKPVKTKNYRKGLHGIYKVSVNVSEKINIPNVPYRTDKLLFPVGKFDTYLTSYEIEYLRSLKGYKIKVHQGFVWFRAVDLFSEFVKYFYNLRLKAKKNKNKFEDTIAKMILNSLLGKWGQHREIDKVMLTCMMGKDEVEKCNNAGDNYLFNPDSVFNKYPDYTISSNILPHISMFVTALGRIELHKLQSLSGHDNVIYSDTDSVVTKNELKPSDGLGGYKLEYKLKKIICLAPKLYAMITDDNKVIIKAKGFQSDENELTFQDFENALFKDDFSKFIKQAKKLYGIKQGTKLKNNITKYDNVFTVLSEKNFNEKLKKSQKTLKEVYTKREILENFDTKPIVIK